MFAPCIAPAGWEQHRDGLIWGDLDDALTQVRVLLTHIRRSIQHAIRAGGGLVEATQITWSGHPEAQADVFVPVRVEMPNPNFIHILNSDHTDQVAGVWVVSDTVHTAS